MQVWEVGVQRRWGWYTAGLRWRQSWRGLAPVVEAATVVARGRRGCDGEGAACVRAREVGVVMVW